MDDAANIGRGAEEFNGLPFGPACPAASPPFCTCNCLPCGATISRKSWDLEGTSALGTPEAASDNSTSDAPVVIKKYANRRLYNTSTSSYVTLDDLAEMVKKGTDFSVYDAKTGEDITRSVLTQIIFDEENKGQNLLPIRFLRQLIRFYGDSMQAFIPSYLEFSLESLTREQERFRQQMMEVLRRRAVPRHGGAGTAQCRDVSAGRADVQSLRHAASDQPGRCREPRRRLQAPGRASPPPRPRRTSAPSRRS